MSYDTSIVIVSLYETQAIEYVNQALRAEPSNRSQQLLELEGSGGFNVLGWETHGAGFDYLDVDSLMGALKSAPWKCPGMVTVHYSSDHGDTAIWNAKHGTLHYDPVQDMGYTSTDPFI